VAVERVQEEEVLVEEDVVLSKLLLNVPSLLLLVVSSASQVGLSVCGTVSRESACYSMTF